VASKSLGTLTLDLVAKTGGFIQGMDKAERSSNKWRKQVERNLKATSQAVKKGLTIVAAGAAAAGAALTGLTIKGLKTVDSQAKLARSLGASFDAVTALSLAFGDAGVNKFEMSLARLNRRLGAAEVGMGEGAKAVKALGLSLEELSAMDVDERVAAIADAVRDSGVSMQRAARFAQDLGFEQKEAAAFFVQGGDAIRGYREELKTLGLSLSDLDAIKVEQANDAFSRTGRLVDGLSQQLAVQFAPILTGVSNLFVQNAKDAGGLGTATADAFSIAIEGAGDAVNSVAELDRQFLRTKAALDVFALEIRNGFLEISREIVELPTAAVNELLSALNAIPKVNFELLGLSDIGQDVQDLIDGTTAEIAEINEELAKELGKPLPGDQFKKYVFEAKVAADESAAALLAANKKIKEAAGLGGDTAGVANPIKEQIKALQFQAATVGMSSDAIKLLKLESEGATPAQLALASAALEAVDAFEKQEAATESLAASYDSVLGGLDAGQRGKEILAAQASEFENVKLFLDRKYSIEESHEQRLQALRDGARQGLIEGEGELNSLIVESTKIRNEELAQLESNRFQILTANQESALGAMGSAMGNFADIAKEGGKETFQSYKNLASSEAFVATALAATKALAATPNPIVNVALSTSIGLLGAVQIAKIQGQQYAGQAHDGIDSVPKSGTWNLEKGERVVTSGTSAKLDRTLDNVQKSNLGGGGMPEITQVFQISPGLTGAINAEIRKAMPAIKQMSQQGVLEAINSGGPMSRATGRRS